MMLLFHTCLMAGTCFTLSTEKKITIRKWGFAVIVWLVWLPYCSHETERKDKTLKKSYEQRFKFSACSKISLCCVISLKVNSEIYYLQSK